MLRVAFSGLAVLGVGVTACHEEHSATVPANDVARTTSAVLGGPVDETSSASDPIVMRIATRRCARDLACERIGAGRRYEDTQACLASVGSAVHRDVGIERCPQGIDEGAVRACTSAIEAEPCDAAPIDGAGPNACRRGVLCWR